MTTSSHRIPRKLSIIKASTAARMIAYATAARMVRHWGLLLCLVAVALPASLGAQQFAPIPALDFSQTFGGDNPLPQMITIHSTGAAISFTAAATTNSGGSWLTVIPSSYGYGVPTPYAITVSAKPAAGLAAGKYTGQVIVTPVSGSASPLTIPVTLVVHATTATYFDQIAGGLTYTLETAGEAPPGQALQIRNAGAGSLAWTATASTADGGAWLGLSAASGTAPSNLTVSVALSKLPGIGLTAGTFTGQVLVKSSADTVSVPITVIVGANVFRQINPLNFNKTFAGANPLSQVITLASTGTTQISFFGSTQNSTGGSWLTINPSNYGYGVPTPEAITVGVNPAVTLAAGTYMAEVMVNSADGTEGFSIPVTLTVNPPAAAYFDDVAGALDFSMETSGDAPPAQELQIRNAGAGTLAWTATASTADGGAWLSVSTASGTAPSIISAELNPKNLPGNGLVAGTYVGQVVLQSSGSRVTVPVTFTVGSGVFEQVNPLNFVKVYGGANPLPQVISIASTGAVLSYDAVAVSSTGGSWLVINPSNYGYGVATPGQVTVSVNPAVTLAAGTYSAEVVVETVLGTQSLTIPVTLTIEPATSDFFDALPGQISFSMATKGAAPPPQVLPIRNAGTGTLDWTAATSTSDGGAWLNISSNNGTAPSNPVVSVVPANLPGGGSVAGTFTGRVLLVTNGNQVSVPVSLVVGANVFRQVNPLSFTMTYGGANPLPQVITVASTGTTSFNFLAATASSTGGSWLTINPANYGYGLPTPYAVTASVNPSPTLAAGTYSSQILITSADGTQNLNVPVTLIIEPKTATFFDALPGQLSFSMLTGGSKPPAEPLEIRNAGAGTLAWTSTLSTADGGAWLAISAASGTAPAVPQVSVIPTKLPGGGLTAGTFTGQVILETPSDRVTIPVTMVVGASVFRQVNALDFNMTFGGANPLPQLINIASTGTSFNFLASVANSTGGNWLTINPSAYGYGAPTPQNVIVSVAPASSLAVGTYSAQIIAVSAAGSPSMVIPVTLTVNPATATYFDDMPGGVSFFQAESGTNPPAQTIHIRNAGAGTLDWTAEATTSDGRGWLSISPASGTAPSSLTVSVKAASLPGKGITAGYFNGQIVLTTGTRRETIPIQVVVGANVFQPIAPLSFSKPFGGSNPAYQVLDVASSSATNFAFLGKEATANGGNWLTINPSSYGYGVSTPAAVEVSVDPVSAESAGSYVGEIILTSAAGDQGMVVPVTLTVDGTTAAATPTFTPPGGSYTSTQTVTIKDKTRGAAIYYTLNGDTPTSASSVYSEPISVTASETIKAVAVAPGFSKSAVATAVYTLTAPTAATPATSLSITIAEASAGATVYYTTNGSTPTTSSTKYTGPIAFSGVGTLKFIAVGPGYTQSAVRTITVQ